MEKQIPTYQDIASMMDHSMLKPFMTDKEIEEGCKLADKYKVASVCVRPTDVPLAAKTLKNSSVKVSTVIGFPHGTTTTATKVSEAIEAIENGCVELDVVMNIGKMKSKDIAYVKADLKAVIDAAHSKNAKIKVIFENCYLDEDEKMAAITICNELKPDWIKTSTGFGTGGATDEDLKLMKAHAAPGIQVKAAGGVRDLKRAIEVWELGCTRFGCTVSDAILEELNNPGTSAAASSDKNAY